MWVAALVSLLKQGYEKVMLDATVGKEGPRCLWGERTFCLLLGYLVSGKSSLWSRQVSLRSLRRGFCRAHSSAWRVMDLVIGRSCHVGSLGRLWLNIHSSLFVSEKTHITKRAKSVTD